MEIEIERNDESNFLQDASGLDDTHNQTGFLLQRLRELQAWQHEQEVKLLQEQEQQLGRLREDGGSYNNNHNNNNHQQNVDSCTDDEDTTIGQDFSSLTSLEEYPPNGAKLDCDLETPRSELAAELESQSLPSWASREDISHQPKYLKSPEERPIVSTRKNFEELLADHLGASVKGGQEQQNDVSNVQNESPSKKTFLRKGSGLVRYGGVGAPPRRMRRSRSQLLPRAKGMDGSKFGGSCPRMNIADRETIAYASKKITPKQTSRPVTSKPIPPSTARPPSILKLVPSATPSPGILRKKESPLTNTPNPVVQPGRQNPKTIHKNDNGLYDSVELSFMEKLVKAETTHKKDLEDLKTFEMLEEAACGSSFCSSSSDVKRFIQNVHHMPSPISKPSQSMESLTSTPIAKRSLDPESSFNGFLRHDIQAFLDRKRTEQSNDSSNDDDSTIGDNDQSGIRDLEPEKPSILNGSESDENEDENGRGSWGDLVYETNEDRNQNGQSKPKNRVRFGDVQGNEHENMSFSPPKVPKNSASYLIWSIFAKDRENQLKTKKQQTNRQMPNRHVNKSAPQLSNGIENSFSPLSNAALNYPKTEFEFHTTLLNAKLAELEREVAHFKTENEKLAQGRRKLQSDRRQLAENVKSFETSKEIEKKKLEEERKWVRREKSLFEKMVKDKKSNFEKRAQDGVDELQAKICQLTDDLQRKETKWAAVVTKLQEQVKFLEKENQHLHQENHKMKLKGISAKVSTHLVDPIYTAKKLASEQNGTPDSGFRSQDNDEVEIKSRNSKSSIKPAQNTLRNTIYNTLCDTSDTDTSSDKPKSDNSKSDTNSIATPRMTFSSADSLDSNVTLVSASTDTATLSKSDEKTTSDSRNSTLKDSNSSKSPVIVKSVSRNEAKGTTEKIYSDGSLEICYPNGNRKEISTDGKTIKVYYYNGDVKETLGTGLVKYFYSQTKTWHLTYPDGKEVLQFSNGQEEIRYPNGHLQISFSDGSIKKISPDGSEDIQFLDGTHVNVAPNGDRTLRLPNGQKEIHTSNMKRREYPDGTVKILHDDGRQETRYASGRVRIKDREGRLLHDSQANEK